MSLGTLESIAEQLTALNQNLVNVLAAGDTPAASADTAPAPKTRAKSKPTPSAAAETETETESKPAASKPAAKKVAAKKAPAKKGDDLANITVFKKKLFEVAEATKVADVMPKLKAFIKESGYASSDEIEVDDREAFLSGVTDHFEALQSETADDSDDDDFDL